MTYAYQNAAHKLKLKSGNWIPQRKPTVTATTALHQMHTENRLFMLNLELWIQSTHTDLCTDNSFRHSHALAATDRSDIHANKGRLCVLPCTCLINKKKPVCVCVCVHEKVIKSSLMIPSVSSKVKRKDCVNPHTLRFMLQLCDSFIWLSDSLPSCHCAAFIIHSFKALYPPVANGPYPLPYSNTGIFNAGFHSGGTFPLFNTHSTPCKSRAAACSLGNLLQSPTFKAFIMDYLTTNNRHGSGFIFYFT